jgi:hypothetical protein
LRRQQQRYELSPFNKVEVYVEPEMQCAWLGPKGWIMVDGSYRGEGLGSYLLCAVLGWLKESYPNCEVATGWLSPVDGADPSNRSRRDAFYRRQGFSLFYRNFETADGAFWASTASALTPCWNTEKVKRLSAWEAVDVLLGQADQLEDVTGRFEMLKRWNRDLSREVHRWRRVVLIGGAILAIVVLLVIAYAHLAHAGGGPRGGEARGNETLL